MPDIAPVKGTKTESYEQFMQRVDEFLQQHIGLTHSDIADCRWRELYEDCRGQGGESFEQSVIDESIEWNDGLKEAW